MNQKYGKCGNFLKHTFRTAVLTICIYKVRANLVLRFTGFKLFSNPMLGYGLIVISFPGLFWGNSKCFFHVSF